jgi:hypothetical protein
VTPAITCGFFLPQDPFHVIQDASYDPLSGSTPPFPVVGDLLHIDPRNFEGDLAQVEVNLYFHIEVRMIG